MTDEKIKDWLFASLKKENLDEIRRLYQNMPSNFHVCENDLTFLNATIKVKFIFGAPLPRHLVHLTIHDNVFVIQDGKVLSTLDQTTPR
jgi:hypothetical protein